MKNGGEREKEGRRRGFAEVCAEWERMRKREDEIGLGPFLGLRLECFLAGFNQRATEMGGRK